MKITKYFSVGVILTLVLTGANSALAGPPTSLGVIKTGDAAGGDLGGTYPNPIVKKINGASLGATTPTGGNILVGTGTVWQSMVLSGDANLSPSGVLTIPNGTVTSDKLSETGVSAGDYKNADITVDGSGRITAASDGVVVIDSDGHVKLSGSTANPTSAPGCVVSGTDNLGDIYSFTGVGTFTCHIVFNKPYQTDPICILSIKSANASAPILNIETSTSGFSVVPNVGTFLNYDDHVYYHCFAR